MKAVEDEEELHMSDISVLGALAHMRTHLMNKSELEEDTLFELNRGFFLHVKGLKMVSGAYYIPKSNKLNPLGEDAYFICDEKQTIGVADGIGRWAKKGIDAGVYARELMANSLLAVQNEPREAVNLNKVLNGSLLEHQS
ncbi:unnamed protein product [Camellia sinensis]